MSLFAQTYSAYAIALFGAVNALLIWILHRQWWRLRAVRHAVWLFPVTGLLADGLWILSAYLESDIGLSVFSVIVSLFLVLSLALTISLPFSGAALTLERLILWAVRFGKRQMRKREEKKDSSGFEGGPAIVSPAIAAPAVPVNGSDGKQHEDVKRAGTVDSTRRSLITIGAAAIPAFAVGSGAYGVLRSGASVVFTPQDMFFPDLHPDLDGFRILHISDLHLGPCISLDSLEDLLTEAERFPTDMVLVSGDTADDLTMLPDALRMIAQRPADHGTYASLGNHEYYRGIGEVLRTFDTGPVPLLVDAGHRVDVGRTGLYLGAADDPAAMGRGLRGEAGKEEFLRKSVEQAFDGAPSDDFHLLMTHRPEGFDAAAELGIPLSVAGHTHGGMQLGWNGRSLVETWFGMGKYMWGHYQQNGGASQLYTSAGAGHWFPFRLGIPREVPIYTLRRGSVPSRRA